ncbi:MAG: hypothetical protein U9R21_06885 [Candidatus Thermoplasmatota archaeon]|nr:hypothetical protein [Candidatus Thermoplasmatota archaeon]
MKSYVVIPENAPRIKIDAVVGYGAEEMGSSLPLTQEMKK